MRKRISRRLMAERKILRAISPAVESICRPPKLDSIKRALFIQPHPDDNQIAAGGTIAKLVASGVEVFELTVLDDRYTDLSYSGEGYTVRQKEALAAQECLGMKNAGFLGFGDRTPASAREISVAIVKVLREIKPDAVFTADPNLENECHEDHIKVADAVKYAVLDATFNFYPEYIDGKPRQDTWKVGTIAFYYTDKANTVVDISEYEELKMQAIGCHRSQMVPGFKELIKLLAQQFAAETLYESVEVFRVISAFHTHCFNLPVG
ncbi:MAG TPA: PIG-L family deacetylase [Clostridiales bacterium]|nr:MAG: 1D-myo-inositol 2-acetamido-2-deoxy-alpha-D-glucopyranoside deacetylase [Firmicutes bacterium ADurb.Bin262]HOU10169.1 PIG-L family deacetylase [Clostridiales bacterium]HQK73085.1 PIG-L family deacetylase [Clostridiales bacterium]